MVKKNQIIKNALEKLQKLALQKSISSIHW